MPPHPERDAPCCLCLLLFPSILRADDGPEIPTVGRPADLPFSGASGDFRVHAAATPTALEAQTPFTPHPRSCRSLSPSSGQPSRRSIPDQLPAFAERFDFLEGDRDGGRRTDGRTWEFAYRLQPKREDVTAVPGVPFVFFNPQIQYPRKGFQVAYSDPIPLTVAPHEIYSPPMADPAFLFTIADGAPVLRHSAVVGAAPRRPWPCCWRRCCCASGGTAAGGGCTPVRPVSRAGAAASPPAAPWPRPRGAGLLPPMPRAARAAAVAADYLRARFDAPAEEPTPDEATACLGRVGAPAALAEQAAALFRACDAARFGSALRPPADLAAEAARFILAVEAATWPAPRS